MLNLTGPVSQTANFKVISKKLSTTSSSPGHQQTTNSADFTSRTIQPYHYGNGNLKGGGVIKVFNDAPDMKQYRSKLDHRLGYCICFCLFTMLTILFIYGLFYHPVNDAVSEYLLDTRLLILNSIPPPTPSTSTTTENIPCVAHLLGQDEQLEEIGNFTVTAELSTEPAEIPTTQITYVETGEPETCLGTLNTDSAICLTPEELQDDFNRMQSINITLWTLFALSFVLFIIVLPLSCFYINSSMFATQFKFAYRALLIGVLIFMLVQIVLLINPLFYAVYSFPSLIDKLFLYKLPRDQELVREVESKFTCKFNYLQELVDLNLQKSCRLQLKNNLVPTYVIVLLVVVNALPFAFIIFTYAWDAGVKETPLLKAARRRIDRNNQLRPRSREDILTRTMDEPQFV